MRYLASFSLAVVFLVSTVGAYAQGINISDQTVAGGVAALAEVVDGLGSPSNIRQENPAELYAKRQAGQMVKNTVIGGAAALVTMSPQVARGMSLINKVGGMMGVDANPLSHLSRGVDSALEETGLDGAPEVVRVFRRHGISKQNYFTVMNYVMAGYWALLTDQYPEMRNSETAVDRELLKLILVMSYVGNRDVAYPSEEALDAEAARLVPVAKQAVAPHRAALDAVFGRFAEKNKLD